MSADTGALSCLQSLVRMRARGTRRDYCGGKRVREGE